MTTGADTKAVKCGVKPYPTSSLNEASVPKSFARPKNPLSKLHSPVELVGVASPNTGPWPSASAKDVTTKLQNNKSNPFMISSQRCVCISALVRAAASPKSSGRNQILSTVRIPGGD